MSIRDKDGSNIWQRLKVRFEFGLAVRQGIFMAEFSGMVARRAKSPGETVALLTEMDNKIKFVEDVTGEEVREMHAPRHEPFGGRMRRPRRSCRSSPTTRRRGRKQCRLDLLKQAPLRRRQLGRRQWQRCPGTAGESMVLSTPWCSSSAGLAKDTVTYPRTVPRARTRANSRTTSARARTTGTGSNYGMYKGGGKADTPSSYGPVKGYGKGDGKSGGNGPL